MSDEELLELFAAVDTDGSGEIDIDEFVNFLESDPLAEDMSFQVFGEAMFQLAQLWVKRKEEEQYAMFLEHLFLKITTSEGGLRDLVVDGDGYSYRLADIETIESFVKPDGEVHIDGIEVSEQMAEAVAEAAQLSATSEEEDEEAEDFLESCPVQLTNPDDDNDKVEQAAAARIQAVQRGKIARKELKDKQRAATRLQAVQRGRQSRRKVHALRDVYAADAAAAAAAARALADAQWQTPVYEPEPEIAEPEISLQRAVTKPLDLAVLSPRAPRAPKQGKEPRVCHWQGREQLAIPTVMQWASGAGEPQSPRHKATIVDARARSLHTFLSSEAHTEEESPKRLPTQETMMHWVASNYSLREPSPKATEQPDHSLLRIDSSQEEQRVVSPAPPPKPTSRAPVLGRSPRMLTATTYASPSSRFKEEWLDSAEPLSSPEVRMLPALSGRRSNTNGIAGNGSRAFRKKRESDRSAWRMREMMQGRGGGTARRAREKAQAQLHAY